MKNRILKAGVAVVFCAVMASVTLGMQTTAQACSLPGSGWQTSNLTSDVLTGSPADGVIAFPAQLFDGTGHALEVEVVEKDSGEVVEGEVEKRELVKRQIIDEWLQCPLEELTLRYLVVWTPDGELEAEQEYVLSVNAEYAPPGSGERDWVEESVTLEVSQPAGDILPEISVADTALSTVTEGQEYECCSCESCCGYCSSDDHRHCWYVSEQKMPAVSATLDHDGVAANNQLVFHVFDDDEDVVEMHWNTDELTEVLAAQNDSGDYCAEIAVEYLPTGQMGEPIEICAQNTGELEFGESAIDWSWPDRCDESEYDPGDGDAGADDAQDGDAGGVDAGDDEPEQPAGCQGVPGQPIGLVYAIIALVGLTALRRLEWGTECRRA